jgi:hypothetical protein
LVYFFVPLGVHAFSTVVVDGMRKGGRGKQGEKAESRQRKEEEGERKKEKGRKKEDGSGPYFFA